MGKQPTRKKKLKHQDFQKIKLKVGKRIPKRANETLTHFKSKAIIISEQIKNIEVTTSKEDKKLTTQKKYNITVRTFCVIIHPCLV